MIRGKTLFRVSYENVAYRIPNSYKNTRIFIIVVDGCFIIIHEVFMCDSSQWNSLWLWQLNFSCFKSYCLFKKKSRSLRHWLQNQTGLHTFKLLLLLLKPNLHEMYSHTYSQHVKVLDFAPFRGSYVREFELSQRNLVNRIIKISGAHSLHVKMLNFAPLTICRRKNTYCLQDYFAQTIF